jgi:hypothetical protein
MPWPGAERGGSRGGLGALRRAFFGRALRRAACRRRRSLPDERAPPAPVAAAERPRDLEARRARDRMTEECRALKTPGGARRRPADASVADFSGSSDESGGSDESDAGHSCVQGGVSRPSDLFGVNLAEEKGAAPRPRGPADPGADLDEWQYISLCMPETGRRVPRAERRAQWRAHMRETGRPCAFWRYDSGADPVGGPAPTGAGRGRGPEGVAAGAGARAGGVAAGAARRAGGARRAARRGRGARRPGRGAPWCLAEAGSEL